MILVQPTESLILDSSKAEDTCCQYHKTQKKKKKVDKVSFDLTPCLFLGGGGRLIKLIWFGTRDLYSVQSVRQFKHRDGKVTPSRIVWLTSVSFLHLIGSVLTNHHHVGKTLTGSDD